MTVHRPCPLTLNECAAISVNKQIHYGVLLRLLQMSHLSQIVLQFLCLPLRVIYLGR